MVALGPGFSPKHSEYAHELSSTVSAMSFPFSRRTGMERTTNVLAAAKARVLDTGTPLLDLTASNPTTAGFAYPLGEIQSAMATAPVGYTPQPFGLSSAREAVATRLGATADSVVLAASTSELYGWLFKLLCDPGDAILAPVPSYPLFEQLATFEGIELQPYPLVYEGRWRVDLPALRAAVTPRTRGILVVNPNNPTGHGLDRETAETLTALKLPVISDEVFADYPLEPATDTLSARALTDVLTFTLGGLSKRCGMPQMKVGWAVVSGPEDVSREALARLELVADTWLSLSTPVQHALPTLLDIGDAVRQDIMVRLHANLACLRRATKGTAIDALRVEGGWYAVLAVPRICSDETWVLRLLEADGVWVQPGWFYDFPETGHLVVSLLTAPDVFAAGVARLVARISPSP